MKKYKAILFVLVVASVYSQPAHAWTSMATLCANIYGSNLVTRCLNAIQAHFELSGTCTGVTLAGTDATPDLAAEGSCSEPEACNIVKSGTSTAPGDGSTCGGG